MDDYRLAVNSMELITLRFRKLNFVSKCRPYRQNIPIKNNLMRLIKNSIMRIPYYEE